MSQTKTQKQERKRTEAQVKLSELKYKELKWFASKRIEALANQIQLQKIRTRRCLKGSGCGRCYGVQQSQLIYKKDQVSQQQLQSVSVTEKNAFHSQSQLKTKEENSPAPQIENNQEVNQIQSQENYHLFIKHDMEKEKDIQESSIEQLQVFNFQQQDNQQSKGQQDIQMCQKHSMQLTIFCVQDKDFICQRCSEQEHKQHKVEDIEKMKEIKKKLMAMSSAKLQQQKAETEKKIDIVKESKDLVNQFQQKFTSYLDQQVKSRIQDLLQKQKVYNEQVDG